MASSRRLASVPPGPTTAPTIQRIELPTGGKRDVDGLLRELARFAFPKGLTGFAFEQDRTGPRCWVTIATHDSFTAEDLAAGKSALLGCLIALGVVQRVKPSTPPPALAEDGAQSPPKPSQPT